MTLPTLLVQVKLIRERLIASKPFVPAGSGPLIALIATSQQDLEGIIADLEDQVKKAKKEG